MRRYAEDRSQAPWPAEKLAATPFLFDPIRRVLICSFPRRRTGPSLLERQFLERVQDRIDELARAGKLPGSVFWIWPDDREEVSPIRSLAPGWLNHWARDRQAYLLRE